MFVAIQSDRQLRVTEMVLESETGARRDEKGAGGRDAARAFRSSVTRVKGPAV